MFEFEANESILVRTETYYFFIFTIYVLVQLDFAFACMIYIWLYGGMFAYESGDDEVDFDRDTKSSIDSVINMPFSPDIMDTDELFSLFEKGYEVVEFEKGDNEISFEKFNNVTDSINEVIQDSTDRYKYLWDLNESEDSTATEREIKNVLQYKLATTNQFTVDEVEGLKAYKTDWTAIPSLAKFKMEKDLFYYQEFMDIVNNYLFQTYIAQGVFPSHEYDFHQFMNTSKLESFNNCKFMHTGKKRVSKTLINP